jgi:hypothetical protein
MTLRYQHEAPTSECDNPLAGASCWYKVGKSFQARSCEPLKAFAPRAHWLCQCGNTFDIQVKSALVDSELAEPVAPIFDKRLLRHLHPNKTFPPTPEISRVETHRPCLPGLLRPDRFRHRIGRFQLATLARTEPGRALNRNRIPSQVEPH